jgi:outer membrane protein OmpA-like peptidoglycan-associated protein
MDLITSKTRKMNKWMTNKYVLTVFAMQLTVSPFVSCKWNRTAKGGTIGAAAGGAVGGVIGSRSDNTVLGALIGAMVGGVAGAAIGQYMDRQAAEIQRDVKGAKVERVGEGIRITFDSGILFDVDSHQLKAQAEENIRELTKVLQKYDDTNILIEGHTDNTGPDDYNQKLSEERADAVADFAKSLGVAGNRMMIKGYGEKQPLEDNATESGRDKNRRVEIGIMADKKLKKAAKRGDI